MYLNDATVEENDRILGYFENKETQSTDSPKWVKGKKFKQKKSSSLQFSCGLLDSNQITEE